MAGRTDTRRTAWAADAELHLAANVARRHYLDHASQVDIAQQLGVSRFKVARLLDRARAEGLVRIQILDPHGIDADLSEELRAALNLRKALVLTAASEPRTRVGALAVRYLCEILPAGGRVGIAWSRSTQALVEHLRDLPPCRFVQLCGVIPRAAEEEQSVDLVRRTARAVGGTAVTFYAPFIVADAPTGSALRRQAGIAEALHECDRLDVAVITAGQWCPGESTVHDALPADEQKIFRRRGAVAESCGLLLDAAGTPLREGLQQRVIAASESQLRSTGEVVIVATDEVCTPALRALIRSGIGHTLITHRAVAERLLLETTRG